MSQERGSFTRWVLAAALCLTAVPARAQVWQGKTDPDGLTLESIERAMPEYFAPRGGREGSATPEALPDVFGPGAVLRVGNVVMKVTNWGHCGNLFTQVSSDPAGQWPGASGVEYLSSIRLAVGAVNPRATDPNAVRRVSYLLEWRPATLDAEDKIYRAYDGIVNGTRFFNDDGDEDPLHELPSGQREQFVDEDFLDGRDTDGDGQVDEDFGALGQEMYSLTMWDNTIQAVNTTFNEKHVPIGLECRQTAWAYSVAGAQDWNIIQYEIYNRSGHMLDSVVVGYLLDMDAGPVREATFFQDDFDLPHYPYGEFVVNIGTGEGDIADLERRQHPHSEDIDQLVPPDSALCPRLNLRVNGFSITDDNGDAGVTLGVPSFLLIDAQPLDPTGNGNAPQRVGWRAFRSFTAGTPYAQGGNPTIDQQRFEFMSGTDNVVQETGFISPEFVMGETKGDYIQWCSIGPWRNVPENGLITVTVAFAVKHGTIQKGTSYALDYERFRAGAMGAGQLFETYPSLDNAFAAQVTFEGVHERREGVPATDFHGRETGMRLPIGTPQQEVVEECPGREARTITVTDRAYSWFDFDCSYCTGVWNAAAGVGNDPTLGGMFHHTWNSEAPPPNPAVNVSSSYNFSDNPGRQVNPSRDKAIVVAWDNLSELTPDPETGWLDFRAYRLWKVSDWSRPVGSPGPAEGDWQLLGEFRLFNYRIGGVPLERNYTIDTNGDTLCPDVFVPNYVWYDSLTGEQRTGKTIPICLNRGDLWDRQSGVVIRPDVSFTCVPLPGNPDSCEGVTGCILNRGDCTLAQNLVFIPKYPIGRYQYVDREVKNGFVYFYSVTAADSVTDRSITRELSGRRSAVEAEGVTPQAGTQTGLNVWVVPNPYRGYARITERPSSWDLTPNAADPTGTHIDFMGLPPGQWTIKIFTVSGDLVQVMKSTDSVNESIRPEVRQTTVTPGGDPQTVLYPGFNRQQDGANDGQAQWNLISRNGQDVVSGIYMFTVESQEGTQRGKFVIIR